MKQQTQNAKQAKSQNRQGIQDASAKLRLRPEKINQKITDMIRSFNIFLIRNIGKGPPGRVRSPAAARGHPPDNKAGPGISIISFNKEFQFINQNQYSNFYKHLNFTIMKKQILILVFLVLAVFAGVNKSYGQALPGTAPRTLTGCIDDYLHPLAGKAYDYQLTGAGTGTYTWWATTDPVFIATDGAGVTTTNLSTYLKSPTTAITGTALTATSANYAVAGGASDKVNITWSSTILATTVLNTAPTFVVGSFLGDGTTTCADNIKAYQIDPKNGFTVDILSLNNSTKAVIAYDGINDVQCIDLVRGANFVNPQIEYDYGTNYFYYEVVAANFSEEWTPTFTFTGHNAVQTPTIEWTYEKPTTPWSASTAWVAGTTKVLTDETITSTGVSIYVRVTLKNNTYEGITPEDVTLAVSGVNKEGILDVNNTDCTQPADATTAALDDTAVQTLKARPDITPQAVSPSAPNTTIVTGNNVNN